MPAERPGILTTIAIIGIVLGSLGMLGSLFSAAGTVLQGQLSDFQPPGAAQPAQQELMQRMNEVNEAWAVPTTIGALANLLASVLLIVGGALVLAGKPVAARLMMYTLVAAIAVDLFNTGLGLLIQFRTLPLMEEMLLESTANMPQGNGMPANVMSIAMWASAAFSLLWLVCKLAYYAVAIFALNRPQSKAWLAGTERA